MPFSERITSPGWVSGGVSESGSLLGCFSLSISSMILIMRLFVAWSFLKSTHTNAEITGRMAE